MCGVEKRVVEGVNLLVPLPAPVGGWAAFTLRASRPVSAAPSPLFRRGVGASPPTRSAVDGARRRRKC